MRTVVKWIAVGAALAFACFVTWEREAPGRERGKAAAEINVRSGKLMILAYGLRSEGFRRFQQILQERYGIEVKPVAGCVVSEDLVEFADAFNHVTAEAARKNYGHDVVAEANREAEHVAMMFRRHQ